MLPKKTPDTIAIVSKYFGEATVSVMQKNSGADVFFAPAIQKVPAIHLRPDLGTFIQFDGDYSGLLIMNFTREAALEYYKKSMVFMGIPAEELVDDHTSEEVLDSVGELLNQIAGGARQNIQAQFGLSAQNNQPNAISIRESILLSVKDAGSAKKQCRRLSFRISNRYSFHIEIFLENTEFIMIEKPKEVQAQEEEELDMDALFG